MWSAWEFLCNSCDNIFEAICGFKGFPTTHAYTFSADVNENKKLILISHFFLVFFEMVNGNGIECEICFNFIGNVEIFWGKLILRIEKYEVWNCGTQIVNSQKIKAVKTKEWN